jgi:hypothetical protein
MEVTVPSHRRVVGQPDLNEFLVIRLDTPGVDDDEDVDDHDGSGEEGGGGRYGVAKKR